MGQVGFALISDITGYSTYLNESELEHAEKTLADLLGVLVEQSRPPFVFSALEGDAVLSYALESGNVDKQTFLERIEETYVEFRRAIDLMVLNNTCQCNACANVSSLDLKFFVHHGSFVIQPVGDVNQLVGPDINLVHRLLKNSVTSETGFGAYLLATEPALNALGVDPVEYEMVAHEESPTNFGPLRVWLKDMHPVYEKAQKEKRTFFGPNDVVSEVQVDLPVPLEHAWYYANQSELRNLFIGSDRYEMLDRREGRVGVGSTYKCYHGGMILPQLVLDWKPFDRVVLRQSFPVPGQPYSIIQYRFEKTHTGTRFTQTITKPKGPLISRLVTRVLIGSRFRLAQKLVGEFRDRILEDYEQVSHPEQPPQLVDRSLIQAAAATSLIDDTDPDS